MTTVQSVMGQLGAWLLEHPKTSAAAFVAILAVWSLGGLALHLSSSDRRARRASRRRHGL